MKRREGAAEHTERDVGERAEHMHAVAVYDDARARRVLDRELRASAVSRQATCSRALVTCYNTEHTSNLHPATE